eukprot:642937-Prorocentrum_minimum.AAC.1
MPPSAEMPNCSTPPLTLSSTAPSCVQPACASLWTPPLTLSSTLSCVPSTPSCVPPACVSLWTPPLTLSSTPSCIPPACASLSTPRSPRINAPCAPRPAWSGDPATNPRSCETNTHTDVLCGACA